MVFFYRRVHDLDVVACRLKVEGLFLAERALNLCVLQPCPVFDWLPIKT